eukprot:TRINITY_DN5217_c0_g1_i4.p1 TRINITY_DN5217_c0_g1~~TRINITY_DN5217_c0_g1_i4.p1  ORF type:complete len:202 (-),score=22.96 TRINITY_DN5217_c0_g1_i4:170-775(-)
MTQDRTPRDAYVDYCQRFWQFDPNVKDPRIKLFSSTRCGLIAGAGAHAIRTTEPFPETGVHWFIISIEKCASPRLDANQDFLLLSFGISDETFDIKSPQKGWTFEDHAIGWSNHGLIHDEARAVGYTFKISKYCSSDQVGICVDHDAHRISFTHNGKWAGVYFDISQPKVKRYPYVIFHNNLKNLVKIVRKNFDIPHFIKC